MDEEEYLAYENLVFGGDALEDSGELLMQLRESDSASDEYGNRIPGCYRVMPARVD